MKPSKTQETEIWQVYDTWLTAYLNADVKTYASYLADDYHFIGSTDNEEFLNKTDTTTFFENTADQLAGKCDLRNETKIIEKFEGLVFITHLFDAWFLNGNDYAYYGRFRFSNALKENKAGWRFIYQHFSTTDSKADEGETIGFDKVNAENIELKEAIKRRTIELESKNRELEVEAALERVRAQTMAMHSSEDVGKCVVKMFSELTALGVDEGTRFGIGILNHDNENNQLWTARNNGEEVSMHIGNIDMALHPLLKSARKAWKGQVPLHKYVLEGEDLLNYYQMLNQAPDYKIQIPIEKLPKKEIQHCFIFEHGFFYAFSPREFQPDLIHITKRFSSLFEQTYRRYLDLVRAEAQAREAEIELVLERVRARTMAMHHTEELKEVIQVVFDQFVGLNIQVEHAGFILDYKEREDMHIWLADQQQGVPTEITISYFDSPHWKSYLEAKAKEESFFTNMLPFEVKNKFYQDLFELIPELTEEAQQAIFSKPALSISTVLLDNVGLYIEHYSEIPFTAEENVILMRFGKVFQQTYTRFLDLKKAEAQAREAKIENALEKVRSRSLAMQSPDELIEVAQLLREEMGALGVEELETSSIYIQDENTETTQCWFTIKDSDYPDNSVTDQMTLNLQDTWVGRKMDAFYRSSQKQTSIVMKGDHRKEWINYCERQSDLFSTRKFYGDTIPERTYHLYKFSDGYIGAAAPGNISEESWDLLRRATTVFSFAYTRFRDLQIAEASARAALRQASLDRVRADISSMRNAKDLERITPLVFNELTTLGIPFIRCGVFIVHEKTKNVEVYLSSPEGKSLAVMNLRFGANDMTTQSVSAWKKKQVYIQHWDKSDFINWSKSLQEQGYVKDLKTYQGDKVAPEKLHLHFVPFKQGLLYVGAAQKLNDEEIDLVKALAESFAIAYARYEDFVKLEKAKAEVEKAMIELKSTQSQLIQSEKMASLGELTAGIAHEIQNPLNFVNNFSEVSNELIDEMNEELAKGDLEEAKLIAADIRQNLEKINHHGKRADGIVKGMLQHSRSSGVKEPTDINALADEYLRLAYHGLRAKDKSFNAELITDFDAAIGKVKVIPQDIGRVILNLITNAFYAVNEKKQQDEHFKPMVSVSTKKTGDLLEIKVTDNGNGIPKEVVDKIFQPFFTTKPTGQGTGLGLSMSYDIITKGHGGELKVETRENKGTEFKIFLAV